MGYRRRGREVRWRKPRKLRPWAGRIPNLATLERQTLPARAAGLIRRRILDGRVRRGARLDSMRYLAAELGISVPTVREAIAQLRGEGLIDVRHGIGCFVVRRPRAARALKAATRRAARREIGDMRVVVEPAVAGIAARRGARARIGDLLSATWELEASRRGRDPEAFMDADLEFHRCVAAAAGGPIGIAAQRLAGIVMRPVMRAAAAEQSDDDRLAELHRALADAIGQGRELRAIRAARAIAWIETRPP